MLNFAKEMLRKLEEDNEKGCFGRQVRHTNGKKKTRQGQNHRTSMVQRLALNTIKRNIEDKVNNGNI